MSIFFDSKVHVFPYTTTVDDGHTILPPPAPTSDLKPRGVKAPMYLIPWCVVPDDCRPGLLPDVDLGAGYPCAGVRMVAPYGARLATMQAIARRAIDETGLRNIALALGYGAAKYEAWNWTTFDWTEDAYAEYLSAICRHAEAEAVGEEIDPDSGLPHAAHIGAGALIASWHEARCAQ